MRKWLARWRAGGEPAFDRSSAPARQRRLPPEQVAAMGALRHRRLTSPVIARRVGLPLSTVGGVLRRLGRHRLKALDPPAPVVGYQRERPGELVHIATKTLSKIAGIGHRITGRHPGLLNRHRGIGWEYPHVAVDDASRLAYTEILPDERKALDSPAPVVRYQRQRPGELVHIDTKKLGRIAGIGHRITGDRHDRHRGIGWESRHVAVDDASRLAYAEILPDERNQRDCLPRAGARLVRPPRRHY